MRDIIFYDLNLFAIFLLVTLMIVIYSKHEKHTLRGNLFRWLVIANIVMLVVEMFSWLFDGVSGSVNRVLNITGNTLVTGLPVFVVSIWAIYIDYMIFQNEDRTRRVYKWYLLPAIIMSLFALLNLVVPFLFVVSADNVYTRLEGIWISSILTIIIYGIIVRYVIRYRRRLSNNFLIGVLIFLVLPQIAAVIQLLYFGLMLIWSTTAVTIVFSYLLFETTSSSLDYLTGVYTRLRAEDYMHTMMKRRKPFAISMIDMDNFKTINDQFGHHVGDKVLIEMGRILEDVFHKKGLVSRFGGDEFFIVVDTTNKGSIKMYRQLIKTKMKQSSNQFIASANFSMGIAYCNDPNDCSIEQLMVHADNNMYLDKAKNKNYKRRKDDK